MKKTTQLTSEPAGRKTQDARAAYTAKEAAQKLAVSVKTVKRWISRGLLPTSKATRKVLIPAGAVDNFMQATI